MIYQQAFSTVYSLLSSNRLFIVPTFQRPFRWETRHISTLITDIAEASNARRDHYISPIHLIKVDTTNPGDIALVNDYTDNALRPDLAVGRLVDDENGPVCVYLVIDGQQRLTATLAVFKAFHALAPRLYSVMIGGQMYPKLIAGSAPEDAQIRNALGLPEIVHANNNNAAATRIQTAFAHATQLAADNPNPPLFAQFLQHNLKTLPVCLDARYALGSFLTLNDRGEQPTTLEKLKAHCIYLDSLGNAPNPLQVHRAFANLYQSLEDTKSLLTDETAVQVATLFFLQGNSRDAGVVYWGAETCFDKVLSVDLRPDNLAHLVGNITAIAKVNNLLVAGLLEPATQGVYNLALKQRPLTHRALAIVMQFAALHNLTAADLAQPARNISLNSNVDIAVYLLGELARLGTPPPALQAYGQQIIADLGDLQATVARSVNIFDLAIMVDACGVKAAAFLRAWNQAFVAGTPLQDSCNSWADGYLHHHASRYRYLRDLLSPGEVSPSSRRYKIALLKDARNGRYWPADERSVEHLFTRQTFW